MGAKAEKRIYKLKTPTIKSVGTTEVQAKNIVFKISIFSRNLLVLFVKQKII